MPDAVMLVAISAWEAHWMEPRDIQEPDLLKLLRSGKTVHGITAAGRYGSVSVLDGIPVIGK